MRVWDGSIMTASSRPSAHGLRLGRSIWPSSSALTEPGARWSWLVTEPTARQSTLMGATRSTQPGAPARGTRPGDSESPCRDWRRSPRARLSSWCSPRRWSLGSPGAARAPAGARSASGHGVECSIRSAGPRHTRSPARPSSGRACGCATVPPVETSQTLRALGEVERLSGQVDAIWIHPADHALLATAPGGSGATWSEPLGGRGCYCRHCDLRHLWRAAATHAAVVPAYRSLEAVCSWDEAEAARTPSLPRATRRQHARTSRRSRRPLNAPGEDLVAEGRLATG